MKLKDFFDTADKWTKNAYARDILGNEVDSDDPFAVSWNISGAINFNYFQSVPSELKTEKYKSELAHKMHMIIDIIGTPKVWEWESNPERTFEEIKSVIEKVDI
jgi:hypothetical protein